MPPKDKAKASGTSASSFFDLKAELAKQQEEFSKNKAAGGSKYTTGSIKRPDRKGTVWTKPNKGVASRAARDIELEAVSRPTLESARAALERKAKIYDKLRKGQSGGLNDKQYDALLVDFDSKPIGAYESDSDDVDESLTVPSAPGLGEDDPVVEYEDEFGRVRTGRRSEIPRELLPREDDEKEDEDEDLVIHNPVNHFPVYEPSAERVAAVEEAYSEAANPLGAHYDASQEVRAKGAAFYQFSGDEETRQRQMEELKAARTETVQTRAETGAVDVKPGDAEEMADGVSAADVKGAKSRAMEKRKRELEERRKAVDAKRRKVKGVVETPPPPEPAPGGMTSTNFVAGVVPSDPFAVLEQSTTQKTGKGKGKQSEADDFLAQLEREMRNGGRS